MTGHIGSPEDGRAPVPSRGDGQTGPRSPLEDRPGFRSHYLPRTRNGWIAVVSFFALFALVEPPFTHVLANRTDPWLLGFPFLYTYLLVLYTGIIGVLIWAQRRRL